MQPVVGAVQHYAWGDPTFIPELLGVEPDGQPWAELWLGTHPNGPTTLEDGRPLSEITGPLPYLLKVLAAGQPLSLQSHPNAEQAVDGFARGVYPDDQPKPELIYALTPFEALCGLRPADATVALLRSIGADDLAAEVSASGPGDVLEGLYRGTIDPAATITACETADGPEAAWVRRLNQMYPGESSVAAILLLNYVTLEPGEVIRLDAGNLHGYLSGVGIELMRASDNVVRGGLTVKHVDVDELLHILDRNPLADPKIQPVDGRFELPAADVALLCLEPGHEHVATGHELFVALDGTTGYLAPGDALTAASETFVVVPLSQRT